MHCVNIRFNILSGDVTGEALCSLLIDATSILRTKVPYGGAGAETKLQELTLIT